MGTEPSAQHIEHKLLNNCTSYADYIITIIILCFFYSADDDYNYDG